VLHQRRRRVIPQRGQVDLEPPPRVPSRVGVAQPQVAVGHVRDAAPAAAHRLEHLPQHRLRRAVAVLVDAARVGVVDAGVAVDDQLDQPHQAGQHVERLEPRHHHRHAVARDERREHAPAGDRRGVAGRQEPLDAGARHLGDDLHHRRDVLVRGQDREVGRRPGEDHRGGGHRGGLEPRREEHQLLVDRPRQLDRLGHAVDDVDRRAGGAGVGQRLRGAGHPQHVAVGRDAHALARERHRLVDLGHVGHAHRAARAHDHVEPLGEGGPQPEPRDRLLVAAAHVHHRDRALRRRAARRTSWVARRPAHARAPGRGSASPRGRHRGHLGGVELAAHVVAQQIVGRRPQQLVVQRQRVGDLLGRDAPDREADVVEDVVAGGDRRVDDVEPHPPLHAEEVDGGHAVLDLDHPARHT
jgi:hypothetical protein